MSGRFEMAPCHICGVEFVFIDKKVRCVEICVVEFEVIEKKVRCLEVGRAYEPVCPNCIEFVGPDLLIEPGRGPSARKSVLVFVFDPYVDDYDYDVPDDVTEGFVDDPDGIDDDGGLLDPAGFMYRYVDEDDE